MTTVRQALSAGQKELRRHRCARTAAPREAAAFLSLAAGLSREELFTGPERRLPAAAARRFRAFIRRRLAHEPFEYVTGSAWCRGLELAVGPGVLIPRPATETIIEAALETCRRLAPAAAVDVGTGSGAIALNLAREAPAGVRIIAVDASAAALRRARANARRNGLSGRVIFRRGDLLEPAVPLLKRTAGPAVIVANLPYIPTKDLSRLPREIRLHEPRLALDGGPDGLRPYRRLLSQATALRPAGGLTFVFEILPAQYRPLAAQARRRYPGLRAERITNPSGVCVGAILSPE